MTPERALLTRLVEAVAHYTDDHLRRAGGAGIPHDYLLGQAMADARALLAEPEGEVCTVMDSEWHLGPIVALGGYYKPGQRVRVVRCEVGMYDPKNDPPTGGAK